MNLNLGHMLDFIVAFCLVVIFFKESDIVKKQFALFLFNFIVFVVFSEYIFGLPYSSKSETFSIGYNNVKIILYLFCFIFFLFTRGVQAEQLDFKTDKKASSGFDYLMAMPIIIFLVYYASNTGVRITGEFMDHRGDRSQLVDYIYVYAMVCLVSLRGSKVIIISTLLLAIAHILAAERMRAFVYIISFLFVYYGIGKKKHQSSFILLIGFVLATAVGLLRIGDQQIDTDYNVTHFGSVTISSLYLLDMASYFEYIDRVRFSIGAFLANLLPSSLVPLDYNVRNYLVDKHNVPGGGWLPVWIYSMTGYLGVITFGFVIAKFYKFIAGKNNTGSLTPHTLAKYCMLVIFLATLPRWFMYTPFQVFKMPLYGYIGTFILVICINNLAKRQ